MTDLFQIIAVPRVQRQDGRDDTTLTYRCPPLDTEDTTFTFHAAIYIFVLQLAIYIHKKSVHNEGKVPVHGSLRGSRGVASLILNLGTKSSVVSFKLQPLYAKGLCSGTRVGACVDHRLGLGAL
jgi:hypothetical protein